MCWRASRRTLPAPADATDNRSMNLSNAVAVTVFEAGGNIGFAGGCNRADLSYRSRMCFTTRHRDSALRHTLRAPERDMALELPGDIPQWMSGRRSSGRVVSRRRVGTQQQRGALDAICPPLAVASDPDRLVGRSVRRRIRRLSVTNPPLVQVCPHHGPGGPRAAVIERRRSWRPPPA